MTGIKISYVSNWFHTKKPLTYVSFSGCWPQTGGYYKLNQLRVVFFRCLVRDGDPPGTRCAKTVTQKCDRRPPGRIFD